MPYRVAYCSVLWKHFLNCGPRPPEDFSPCQIDIKLSSTLCMDENVITGAWEMAPRLRALRLTEAGLQFPAPTRGLTFSCCLLISSGTRHAFSTDTHAGKTLKINIKEFLKMSGRIFFLDTSFWNHVDTVADVSIFIYFVNSLLRKICLDYFFKNNFL